MGKKAMLENEDVWGVGDYLALDTVFQCPEPLGPRGILFWFFYPRFG
jgi:hypothetical protein